MPSCDLYLIAIILFVCPHIRYDGYILWLYQSVFMDIVAALHSCNHCPGDLEHSTVYETRAVKL